jgi:hypothetical protein
MTYEVLRRVSHVANRIEAALSISGVCGAGALMGVRYIKHGTIG